MTTSPIDKAVKRAALYAGALMVVASAFGLLNKWIIADPITRATAKIERAVDAQAKELKLESEARRTADQVVLDLVQSVKGGQEGLATGMLAATYSRSQIDGMKADQEREQRELREVVESLGRQVDSLRAARGRR